MTGLDLRALEAVKPLAAEYGLEPSRLKPCIAVLLAGDIGHCEPHNAAFTVAIELRALGLDEKAVESAMVRWAHSVRWRPREAQRTAHAVFRRNTDGSWRWRSPGLRKTTPTYRETLVPICEAVGCPHHCPPFNGKYQGDRCQDFKRFRQLGWPKVLRTTATVETYKAICDREKELGLAPGSELRTSYRQLGQIGGHDHKTIGRCLKRLRQVGLVEFTEGSGSGPQAKDRTASVVKRVVPIPPPPSARTHPPIGTGGERPPDIGGQRPPKPPPTHRWPFVPDARMEAVR